MKSGKLVMFLGVLALALLVLPSILGTYQGSRSKPLWTWDLMKGSEYQALQLKKNVYQSHTSEWKRDWFNLFLYREWRTRPYETFKRMLFLSISIIILVYLFKGFSGSSILFSFILLLVGNSLLILAVDNYKKAFSEAYTYSQLNKPAYTTSEQIEVLNAYLKVQEDLPYLMMAKHHRSNKYARMFLRYKANAPKGATPKNLLIYLIMGLVGLSVLFLLTKIRR